MWQQMEELAIEKELDQHFQLKRDKESEKETSKVKYLSPCFFA